MFPPCIKILVRDSDISDNRHQHRHFPIKSLNIFSRPSTSLAAFFCVFCVDRPHAELRNGANIPINTSSAAAEGRRCCSRRRRTCTSRTRVAVRRMEGGGELQSSVASTSVYGFAAWRIFPHFGRMPMKNSAFMRGMGRPSTDRYSSLKRLLTVAFSVRSAHPNAISRSSDTLLI